MRWMTASLLLVCVGSAFAEDYSDPSGFSFTCPEGWVVLNRERVRDVGQKFPPEIKEFFTRNKVSLDRVSVMAIRVGQEEVLENINVVVENLQVPADEKGVNVLSQRLPLQFEASGVAVEGFRGDVRKINSRDVLSFEYVMRMPQSSRTLRQRQVWFPGGGKTYIITCTGAADAFDRYRPVFDAILNSFQAPPAPSPAASREFDWNSVGRSAFIGAIAGAVGGGLAAILYLFGRRKKLSRSKPGEEGQDFSTPRT